MRTPLWDRAVAIAKATGHLVPRTMVTRTQEHSADGKLRSTRETHMRALIVDGELTYELVRDVKDGQAVEQGEADGRTGASSARFSDAFQADLSAMAGAERVGERRTIRGQPAIGYRIEQPEELYTIRAQLWTYGGLASRWSCSTRSTRCSAVEQGEADGHPCDRTNSGTGWRWSRKSRSRPTC